MKRLAMMIALVPALVLAAPSGPPAQAGQGPRAAGGPGAAQGAPGDDAAWMQRAQRRMRVATTVGLAEALDLDEAGAIRVRDVLAKSGERRMPVLRQVRDNVRILRDAARGDQAAAGQVDGAIAKLRDARGQLQAIDHDMFQQLTQGLSGEKKAKAALFLARFRENMRGRASHAVEGGRGPAMMHGPGMRGPGRDGGGPGPGYGPGPGFRGRGPGGAGFGPPEGQLGAAPGLDPGATAMGPMDPDLEDWFGDE